MMSSLACGEYGASLVLRQFNEMGRRPALEVLSWRRLFTAIVEYCVRYSQIYAEVGAWRLAPSEAQPVRLVVRMDCITV
jgi:hypothetical protein